MAVAEEPISVSVAFQAEEDDELASKEMILLKYFLIEWSIVKSILDDVVSSRCFSDLPLPTRSGYSFKWHWNIKLQFDQIFFRQETKFLRTKWFCFLSIQWEEWRKYGGEIAWISTQRDGFRKVEVSNTSHPTSSRPSTPGPRTCLGKKMVVIQMKMVATAATATVIYHYDIEVVKGHKVSASDSIIIQMKHGLKVKLSKRNVYKICLNILLYSMIQSLCTKCNVYHSNLFLQVDIIAPLKLTADLASRLFSV